MNNLSAPDYSEMLHSTSLHTEQQVELQPWGGPRQTGFNVSPQTVPGERHALSTRQPELEGYHAMPGPEGETRGCPGPRKLQKVQKGKQCSSGFKKMLGPPLAAFQSGVDPTRLLGPPSRPLALSSPPRSKEGSPLLLHPGPNRLTPPAFRLRSKDVAPLPVAPGGAPEPQGSFYRPRDVRACIIKLALPLRALNGHGEGCGVAAPPNGGAQLYQGQNSESKEGVHGFSSPNANGILENWHFQRAA